jgi:hypothetical protein
MAGKPDDDALPYLYGEDGWPLGGPSNVVIARAAQTRLKRDMQAALDRWQGGDLTAFADAVRLYWQQHPQQFPYELVEASEALVERAMAEDEKRARREWRIHLARWEALTELRERRHELNKPSRVPNEYGEIVLQRDDRGMTWEGARGAVSEILKKQEHEATGSADAVKASYELIEAAGAAQATFDSFLKVRRRRSKPG